MKQQFTRASNIPNPRATDLALTRDFLAEHGDALCAAACLLGGSAAAGRVALLVDAVRETDRLTRVQRRQLVDLHRLLTLEHVGDPDRIETARFAAIDPGSPVVEDVCLLAEALEDLLRTIAAAPSAQRPPIAAEAPVRKAA